MINKESFVSKKILVVDDEPSIAMLIHFNLNLAGFEVLCVHDGEAVFPAINKFRPDVIILDLMLPKMDGIQVCRELRKQNNLVPVIMLTALQDIPDKIAGLDNGADDYMTKPFSPPELISRIHSLLRRSGTLPASVPTEPIVIGQIAIQPDQRLVTFEGIDVELTPKEYDLLLYLCAHKGKVLSRQQLLQGVWDYHFAGDTRIVDVHISHLRDKMEKTARNPKYIITVRNIGYKLSDRAVKDSSTG